MSAHRQKAIVEAIFASGGQMGELMRALDWSQTPMGAVETWPQSLKTAIRIILGSRYPMFVWWGQQMINFYNDAYIPILGQRHPAALGQSAFEVWADVWNIVGPQAEAVLHEGKSSWNKERLLIMERNGYLEEAYFTFSYSPVTDDLGGLGGVFCAVTEETERVLSDRRLRTLRELGAETIAAKTVEAACKLSATVLTNNAYDIPFALFYLLDGNRQQARLVSTTRLGARTPASPEVIELTFTETPDVWQLKPVMATAQSRIVDDLESRFGPLPGGVWSQSPSRAAVLPLTRLGQETFGFLIVGVNSLREFDDDYKGFFDLIAGQVTTAIINAQAYEEERKRTEALAELDRAKTAFFNNVSHEFRTPLTLMLGSLDEMLNRLDGHLTSREQEQLQMLQRNGQRLLKLVNTLLDFSRIEAGRMQAIYQPIDLAAFTAELASVFHPAIKQAELRFAIDCLPLSAPAYVDQEMWEKIVLNLLSNAFKFTFIGEIAISLRQSNDQIELEVRDTGIGIPEAELPHIFERFHRVRGAKGRTYEGSGIGLSLVQELVRLHGGTIQVNSVVDQGTSFIVSIPTGCAHLPRHQINATPTLVSTATGAALYVEEVLRWLPENNTKTDALIEGELCLPSVGTGNISSARILLVDDNSDMRDYVRRLLAERGYTVETVANGMAALDAVRQQLPDLIVSDVMMPQLDGFGLLQALRANATTQHIPIILLSARAGEEAQIEGLAAGADDYLTKPFSARELLARVEANLKLAQLRQDAKLREQALRLEAETAKQNLETILSSINDGFYALDRNWCYAYVNERLCEMVGMRRENMLGQSIWQLFSDIADTEVYVQFHRAMTEQTPIQFEYFYPTWNRWYENRLYPSPNSLTVFVAEITDRKRVEEDLRQKNAILSVINESAPTPIFVKDRHGRIIYANPATLEALGKTASEVIGCDERDLYPPEEGAKIMANDQRIMNLGQTEVVEESPDGIRTFLGMKAPYRNEAGEVIGLIGVSNDITERVQLEREREQILQQEQAAREEAERANRIKDEFLAVLSHELRSPLNPILGWTKLLRSGRLDATKTVEALATIERNAKLQTELIEDLLDVSRILRGKLSLNIRSVNLVLMVEAAIETVSLAAQAKAIEIQTIFDDRIGQVLGDASRLQQIVWNLVSNAVKFTPSGGQIEVRLSRFENQAQITVTDTGKGINPKFLPHIFDYFRQEDSTTTRKFGGLGLGLAIVRHLVELHGGTVQANSLGEGQGATFTVRLPLQASEQQLRSEQRLSSFSNVVTQPLLGKRVLVVDDEIDMRELVAFCLEQVGANVFPVSTAAEALTALPQFQPDILLSDIGMPDTDGYMLLRQVRALPPEKGGNVLAIALSAYAGEFDQKQALQAGFQQHLAKPVEPDALVRAITRLLENS